MKISMLNKTLAGIMVALMVCTSISAMAEKQLIYVGPATATHDYGQNVTGTTDKLCHEVVRMYYDVYLGHLKDTHRFIDAKFAWFDRGREGDARRNSNCYTQGQSRGWEGGKLVWLPKNPQ